MSIPTGLAAQLGVAAETAYGTPVTVTRFYELVSESMKMEVERLESRGLRAGTRILRSAGWAAGRKSVGGDLELELKDRTFGRLFTHMFGGAAVTNPATGVYEHTFTPDDLPTSMTVQIGRPSTDGTVRSFTYHGCKVAGWEIGCQVGEIGRVKLSLVGEDEDTSTSLATASYSAANLLTFTHGALTIGGSAVKVRAATIKGQNGLSADRHMLGSQLMSTPLEGNFREYTVDLDAEFADLTQYNRINAATEAALVLAFTGATITTGYSYVTQLTCQVRFDGETPTVSGPEEIQLPLRCKIVQPSTSPGGAITLLYRTSDATA